MEAYDASWATAFTARGVAFTDALFLTTKKDIKKATDATWKTFKKAIDTAKKAKKTAIQATRSAFRTEVKACKGDLANVMKDQNGKSDLND